jgi:hypothetical protein
MLGVLTSTGRLCFWVSLVDRDRKYICVRVLTHTHIDFCMKMPVFRL